ncbi:ser/thr protein phosphatase superfamily [Anaeramoeba ignava]|uniref:Ser/thr protein phosphatase superfamily n=1 Tax=Anaeramoeba ignava TaxID=1746090 RepID=A0A9Q0R8P3_ANAIG|nr:ser/thr protein phosphatase superfamily [Anaeramoeba ignava]
MEIKELNFKFEDELTIQISSDLHLEFYRTFQEIPEDIIEPKAKYLLLAGDIGIPFHKMHYANFLEKMSTIFEQIFLIAGNHEYYNITFGTEKKTIKQINEIIEKICEKLKNVHFLNNKSVIFKNEKTNQIIRLIGSTLWSYIPQHAYLEVHKSMNDYCKIFIEKGKFVSANETSFMFEENLDWIKSELAKSKELNEDHVIVATHHTPLMKKTSHPKFDNDNFSSVNHAFSTNISELFKNRGSNIHTWICGHTHYCFDFVEQGTRIVGNQRGYFFESVGYDPAKTISIPSKNENQNQNQNSNENQNQNQNSNENEIQIQIENENQNQNQIENENQNSNENLNENQN